MAVVITRTAWIDDDGSGTTGTIINNAVKTELYGQIDAALAQLAALALPNAFTDTTDSSSATTGALTTAGGLGVAKNVCISGNITVGTANGSNYGVITPATGTGTGLLKFQAGGGSPGFGGGLILYSHANASFPGWVKVGISSGSSGRFTVNSTGDGSGTDLFTVFVTSGVNIGAPTGGDKGAGTLNVAGAIYLNGTAYTNPDYVLEHYYTGRIERFKANRGASDYSGLTPLSDVSRFMATHYELPLMALHKDGDLFERGDLLLGSVEQAFIYLSQHEARLAALEH